MTPNRPVSSAAAISISVCTSALERLIRSRNARSTRAVRAMRAGRGAAPLSWSARSSVGNSSSASGLPPDSVRSRVTTSSAGATPARCASRFLAASGSRPASVSTGSESGANDPAPPSPCRAANTTATWSACSCRAANSSASADAWSSQCASSTTQSTGPGSVASVRTERVATPTRNGSTGSPPPSSWPNATRSARAWGAGSRSQARTGRSSRCSAANGNGASEATPVVVRMRKAGCCGSDWTLGDQVGQEGGLARTRVADHREHRRVPGPRRGDQRSQLRALGLPSVQHVANLLRRPTPVSTVRPSPLRSRPLCRGDERRGRAR